MTASCLTLWQQLPSIRSLTRRAAGRRLQVVEVLETMLADEERWDSRQREMVCNLLLCVYERARMCVRAHELYDRMQAQV